MHLIEKYNLNFMRATLNVCVTICRYVIDNSKMGYSEGGGEAGVGWFVTYLCTFSGMSDNWISRRRQQESFRLCSEEY